MATCDRDFGASEPGEFDKKLGKSDGVWKYQDAGASKDGGVWKRTNKSYVKEGGAWKQTFDFCKCNERGYCSCENVYSCTCDDVSYCSCNDQCTCNNRGCSCNVVTNDGSAISYWSETDPNLQCDCMYNSPCYCDRRSCNCMHRGDDICSSVNIGCNCDTRDVYSTCNCNSQTACPCNTYHGCNCDARGTL